MSDLTSLRDEAAEALLKAIKKGSESYVMPDQLKDLADAYALVVAHTPGPKPKQRPVASPGVASVPATGDNPLTVQF